MELILVVSEQRQAGWGRDGGSCQWGVSLGERCRRFDIRYALSVRRHSRRAHRRQRVSVHRAVVVALGSWSPLS